MFQTLEEAVRDVTRYLGMAKQLSVYIVKFTDGKYFPVYTINSDVEKSMNMIDAPVVAVFATIR